MCDTCLLESIIDNSNYPYFFESYLDYPDQQLQQKYFMSSTGFIIFYFILFIIISMCFWVGMETYMQAHSGLQRLEVHIRSLVAGVTRSYVLPVSMLWNELRFSAQAASSLNWLIFPGPNPTCTLWLSKYSSSFGLLIW